MNNKPVIITDVDSVLLDWVGGFADFLKSKGICTEHIKQHLGTTLFIPTYKITQIDCENTNKLLVKEFSKSNFLKNLEAFQKDSIQHIKELSVDFDFAALTCISKNKKIKRDRTLNLQNIYGDIFIDVICIGYGQSKEPHLISLKEKHNVFGFIDDRMKHIEESISAGIKPILFSRGVDNVTCPNNSFTNMTCWSEIKELMQTELSIREQILNNSSKPSNNKRFKNK